MSRIRVLVGTRKGAFILTSDAARRDWQVSGPFFGGWEIFHITGSPANPDRLYAAAARPHPLHLHQRAAGADAFHFHGKGPELDAV